MSKRIKHWSIALMHGMFLFVICWIWLSMYSTYGEEGTLIKWASTIKRTVFQMDDDPGRNEYLFINLAYDKELVPSADMMGKEVITDRCQLSSFLSILNKYKTAHKFAICDVNLVGDAPCDSALTSAVAGLPNIVFPIHDQGGDTIEVPKFPTHYGIADYKTKEDYFLKFRVVQQQKHPSIPAHVHNVLDGGNIENGWLYNTDRGRPIFNSMIIDFPIRTFEVFEGKEYPVVNLAEIMLLPEEVIINEFVKNKFILLGDFNTDVHSTMYGSTPGTLILLNVYLTLKNGYHLVSPWWVLMMILLFTLVSYYLFYHEENIPARLQDNKRYSFLASLLNYLLVFGGISILSYILFNVYVNILILALYANCLGFLIGVFKKTKHFPTPIDIFNNIKSFYFSFK